MTPHDDPRRPESDDVAPDHVQDAIAAMLRRHAEQDSTHTTMPGDVEARLRGALAAEMARAPRRPDASTSAPQTVVPLPSRSAAGPSGSSGASGASGSSDAAAHHGSQTSPATPVRASDRPARSSDAARQHAVPGAAPASRAGVRDDDGASVTSLEGRRRRSSGLVKGAMALGAAAAIAIGAIAIDRQLESSDGGSQTAQEATSSPSGENYASQVRITETATKYTRADLAQQASALPASTSAPLDPSAASARSLGPLTTSQGVQRCLSAVNEAAATHPDKIYADFATYDGQDAVVVVTVKGSTKTVWVVSRGCEKATDLKAGPSTIST